MSSNKEEAILQFSAKGLDKMDWFGKSDPFLEFSRSTESNKYILVHRSEVIKNTLDPEWRQFNIKVRALCNGDDDRDIKVDVYDWNRSGDHEIIGTFHTNMRKLREGPGPDNVYDVVNEKKRNKKGSKYKNSGTVNLRKSEVHLVPSFLDYIQGGTQVNFTLAVDFTASNGNPQTSNSLHYIDPTGRPNQYLTAINSVGEIIQDYDTDKLFPALGFGARLPPFGNISHEFFLNLSTSSPYCEGIEGVVAAYHQALNSVQLYGPTNFSPVINHVAKIAAMHKDKPSNYQVLLIIIIIIIVNYQVLLIITDGIITDMDATKHAIIAASHLPMSIIIVGVGSVDFAPMDELDSDDQLLQLGSSVAKRDIVQFVELNQFLKTGFLGGWDKELLAREVLAELPGQIVGFMRAGGHKPGRS